MDVGAPVTDAEEAEPEAELEEPDEAPAEEPAEEPEEAVGASVDEAPGAQEALVGTSTPLALHRALAS